MTAAIWTGLVAAILGAVAFLANLFSKRQAKADGAALQAGKTAAAAVKTEAAIAEAVVKAPDTKAEVIDRLNKGEF